MRLVLAIEVLTKTSASTPQGPLGEEVTTMRPWGWSGENLTPLQLIFSSPACLPPGAALLTLVASKKDLHLSECQSVQLLHATKKPMARLIPKGEDFEYI